MQKILHCSFLLSFLCVSMMIKAQNEVLFQIGDTKVKKSEFEYIYKKNNFNNKADFSKKSLEDYLKLYVNFRLKVKEATALGIDTTDQFKSELSKYEQQLLDSYVDKEIMQKLIQQEYERSKTDVHLSHVFFKVSNVVQTDSIKNKCIALVKQIKDGLPFAEAAKQSDDSKTAGHAGNLGWFNSYQIALPEIEEAAYTLKVGQISEPIRTRLGYHILRLDETRKARPQLKVAIIKQYLPIDENDANTAKMIADSVQAAYTKLKAGMPFEKVVEQYSQDETSVLNKGVLGWFGINKYAAVFEETAYALKDGEFSKPFKTNTAWYIIKRLETAKEMSYNESSSVLKSKLAGLPVYAYEIQKFLKRLDAKFNVQNYPEVQQNLRQRLIEFSQKTPFVFRDTATAKTILKIGNRTITENDLGKIIQQNYYTTITKQGEDKYDALIKNALQQVYFDYYKEDVKTNNEEYKTLMNEYKNGIMIFTLSENYVWNKASEDTLGLKKYYDEHTDLFALKNRATIRTFTIATATQAQKVTTLLKQHKNMDDDALLSIFKNSGLKEVKIQSQVLDETKTNLNVKTESISQPKLIDKKYSITQVMQPQPARSTTYSESKGYVVAAYQEFLENKWLDTLKQKYPVQINNAVLESLVKKP